MLLENLTDEDNAVYILHGFVRAAERRAALTAPSGSTASICTSRAS